MSSQPPLTRQITAGFNSLNFMLFAFHTHFIMFSSFPVSTKQMDVSFWLRLGCYLCWVRGGLPGSFKASRLQTPSNQRASVRSWIRLLTEVVSGLCEVQQHRCSVLVWKDRVNAPALISCKQLHRSAVGQYSDIYRQRVWAMWRETLLSHKSQGKCKQKQTETIPSLLCALVQITSWRFTRISIISPLLLAPSVSCMWQRPADIYIHNRQWSHKEKRDRYRIRQGVWLRTQTQRWNNRAGRYRTSPVNFHWQAGWKATKLPTACSVVCVILTAARSITNQMWRKPGDQVFLIGADQHLMFDSGSWFEFFWEKPRPAGWIGAVVLVKNKFRDFMCWFTLSHMFKQIIKWITCLSSCQPTCPTMPIEIIEFNCGFYE